MKAVEVLDGLVAISILAVNAGMRAFAFDGSFMCFPFHVHPFVIFLRFRIDLSALVLRVFFVLLLVGFRVSPAK